MKTIMQTSAVQCSRGRSGAGAALAEEAVLRAGRGGVVGSPALG